MIYLQLFLAFLQIGAFSFGGGYAAMPLIEEQVINTYHLMTMADFSDLVTIAEMTPGPIAVNAATFVGNQAAGIPGALIATLGVILPSCIFVTVLAWVYKKYRKLSMVQGVLGALRPAVIAMIFSAGLKILIPALFASGAVSFVSGNFQVRIFLYFLFGLIALRKFKLGPIKTMVCCGAAEAVFQLFQTFA